MPQEGATKMRGMQISDITEEDAEFIRYSADYLQPMLPGILDQLYEHLLSLPENA